MGGRNTRRNRNSFSGYGIPARISVLVSLLLYAALAALPVAAQDDAVFKTPSIASGSTGPTGTDDVGVKIQGIRTTAGGFMMDFRFTVLDAEKALPLFDPVPTPYLEVVKNGARFTVPNPPKVGSLRPTGIPESGRTYWIFFANPGRYVAPGTEVRIVMGDIRIEHLILE